MRIIGGTLRGRTLERLPRKARVRPTTDRVREAMFNMIEARMSLAGATVLDLYAGTGALAFEAVSRGAAKAILVERDPRMVALARRNALALGIKAQCLFVPATSFAYLENAIGGHFDLILADPPYGTDDMAMLVMAALRCLRHDGILAIEHDSRTDWAGKADQGTARAHGRSCITLLGG